MFPPFPCEKAYKVCLEILCEIQKSHIKIKQISSLSLERKNQGVMLGVLVCYDENKNEINLVTLSGIGKKLEFDADFNSDLTFRKKIIFVEPIVNLENINFALRKNDKKIHDLTCEIKIAEEVLKSCENEKKSLEQKISSLKKIRNELCNESLKKVYALYNFTCADKKVLSLKQICENQNYFKLPPTGTGDCCEPKLLNFAFKNNLQVLSMAQIFLEKSLLVPKVFSFEDGVSLEKKFAIIDKEKFCVARNNFIKEKSLLEEKSSSEKKSSNKFKNFPKLIFPCDERCGILLPEMLGIKILYRDEDIILVDKQSGILSVPGRGPEKQDCIVSRVRRLFPDCIEQPSVHRLDMETSGLMVLAFTKDAHRNLSEQFALGTVKKSYVALVDGVLAKKGIAESGQMELYFRLDVENRPHQIWDEVYGKKAITEWKILNVENYVSPKKVKRAVTRVLFLPHTGRTHQLRLAASSEHGFSCAIIGDSLYGKCEEGERLMLHANFLSFVHPRTNKIMTFESKVPF